jgi:Flp pilus assembly protein TadD
MTTIVGRMAASAFFAIVLFGGTSARAQVTYTFNQEAPLSPIPKSEREFSAFLEIQDERNAERKIRMATDFLSDYFDSEFRHLALRLQFQARYTLDNWRETIRAAEEALAAEEAFATGKLGFISDPESLGEWPAFQLDQANQKSIYYRAMTEGSLALGDSDAALRYGEMALDTQEAAWALFVEQTDPATPAFADAEAAIQASEERLIRTLLSIHRNRNDVSNVLASGRRLLDVRPDDLETLMTVAQLMSVNAPEDETTRRAFLEDAEGYATRAVAAMQEWIRSEASSEVSESQKADYMNQAYSNLGMIHFQTGDFTGAAEAFSGAAEALPRDPVSYYRLGVAYNNSQNVEGAASSLARAVFLGFADARPALEAVYQARSGSLDGLDEFIRGEGERIAEQ